MSKQKLRPKRQEQRIANKKPYESNSSKTPASSRSSSLQQTAVLQMQQRVGNKAVQGKLGQTTNQDEAEVIQRFFNAGDIMDSVSKGFESAANFVKSAAALKLNGSVGRGGENNLQDVLAVQNRLRLLGFLRSAEKPAGNALPETIAAIERYQKEVLEFRRPDGRIDPGAKTVKALNAWQKAPAGQEEPGVPKPGAAPTSAPETTPEPPAAARLGDLTNQSQPPVAGAAAQIDGGLAAFVASLNNPAAMSAAQDLATLEQKYKEVARENTEEKGQGRDELVAGIAQLRRKIDALDNAGINPADLAELKKRLYRGINDVSPFYAQSRNMDLLEGKEQAKELGTSTSVSTRTCNITSLSMALESLGKSAGDYDGGKRDEIMAAAKVFASEVRSAKLKVGGDGGAWNAMEGLRLSDFVQLAAIAEVLSSGKASNARIIAAAKKAWGKILSIYFLKDLAERFGADASVKLFTLDPSKTRKQQRKDAYALRGWSKKYRRSVEKMVDDRNKMEASTGMEHEKYKKRYERRLKSLNKAMTGVGIEKRIALDAYKDAVTNQVGKELDAGSAVVVALSGHYVRLQAIHDDHLIVDDPGSQGRANRKVTWAEARAMGYLAFRLVIK